MLRVFQNDLTVADNFVVTLELVPGRESTGRAVDTVMGIARDAFADGRISAVSITDNPGGNPSLSPDVIGSEIFKAGMDVIVHFTCRDMNRVGIESRALQLAMMGMKNILALTGDYSGQGFGGQGAPVFDIGSVHLQIFLNMLSERLAASGDPDGFFAGCAVSPFKQTEAECYGQYAKLCRKAAAGARFAITQLGYDARKFDELIRVTRQLGMDLPLLGSVYVLTPHAARIMHRNQVPGAVVTRALTAQIDREWGDKATGRRLAVERAARLAAILKGLGYRGMHIGGIHRHFDTAGRILDRFEQIADQWRDFLPEFDFPQPGGFYVFGDASPADARSNPFQAARRPMAFHEALHFHFFQTMHDLFFDKHNRLAPGLRAISRFLDRSPKKTWVTSVVEDPLKWLLLGCRRCGDCGIQHVGFLCPESGCPKHTRNGACGGSRAGWCEVHPDRHCVWYRAYRRLAAVGQIDRLVTGCVPPRAWELDHTSSWLNFHLDRDHQGTASDIVNRCAARSCRLPDFSDR